MSVIAIASAKGSPGVTTTALALAAVWPRRVLVAECDPVGGDLSYWFGQPATPGLLTLGSAARRGLSPAELWRHTQVISGSLPVLLGVLVPEHAAALGPLWEELPAAFAEVGADVLIDCAPTAGPPPRSCSLVSGPIVPPRSRRRWPSAVVPSMSLAWWRWTLPRPGAWLGDLALIGRWRVPC